MRRFAGRLAFCALALGAAQGARAQVEASGVVQCSIDVYSLDEDPKGLNVRAGPSASAAIVATLENSRSQNGEDFEVEMHVVGSKDGWLLIDRAWFRDYGEPAKAGTVFSAKGWVTGRLAGSDIAEAVLRAEPSVGSKIVATLYSPNSSSPAGSAGRFEVSRIFACKGEWADVEGEFRGKTARGWARRLCSDQAAICR